MLKGGIDVTSEGIGHNRAKGIWNKIEKSKKLGRDGRAV